MIGRSLLFIDSRVDYVGDASAVSKVDGGERVILRGKVGYGL